MSEPANEIENGHREIWELIRTLVLGQASPSHILELYYWSQDPALLDFVRAVVLLPAEDRLRLFDFFSTAKSEAISISKPENGRLMIAVLP